jgi:competence protein ComEC
MEALFLDVGFGTSNVILTGSGSAIVIDAGKQSRETLAALKKFSICRIDSLVISHWHADHMGGALGVMREYAGNIGKIWFPFDSAFQKTELWAEILRHEANGDILQEDIESLMIQSAGVREIWSSPAHQASLQIVSPCFMEVLRANAAADSNATSGILVLRVGGRCIVFGGDAVLSQWQDARRRLGQPIYADVVAIPHHAGVCWPTYFTPAQIESALDVLYSDVVRPKVAVISTGTRPGKHHPREDVVKALRRASSKILCTQMTHRCTSDLEAARALQQGSVVKSAGGRSSPLAVLTNSGHSNHVACAGSVFVDLAASGATVHQIVTHDAFLPLIPVSKKNRPLCQ